MLDINSLLNKKIYSSLLSIHISLEVKETDEECCYFLPTQVTYVTVSMYLDDI